MRQRVGLCFLVGVLLVAGVLEMGTILLIFGFVRGLNVAPDGHREGRLMTIVEKLSNMTFSHNEYVLLVGAGVLSILAFKNVLTTLAEFAVTRFFMKLNQRVARGLFQGYLVAPYERIDEEEGVAHRISHVFDLFSSCFSATARFLSDAATVSMVLLVLFWVHPTLTAAAILLFGAVGGGIYRGSQVFLQRLGREERKARREGDSFLRDGLVGAIETRLRDGRNVVARGFSQALSREALVQRRKDALKSVPKAANEVTLVLFVIVSVYLLTPSGEDIGDALPTLTIFGFAALKMKGYVTRLNRSLQQLRLRADEFEEQCENIRMIAPRVLALEVPEVSTYLQDEKKKTDRDEIRMRQELRLKGVHFGYPSSEVEVLRRIDLTVSRGSFVGICGPSGGGKSTLALCLMGLVRPTQGQIEFDGRNLFEHVRAWHKNIGYVGQLPYFSRRTIRENIAFATPEGEIDDDRVWQALRMAAADHFVEGQGRGIYEPLRKAGRALSGGQRQRLAIARALYHDPELLILDEATAALDNATERAITRSVQELSGKKTIVSIAHRLSTLRNCDVIHVIAEGRLAASGRYDELLESSPDFQALAAEESRPH